MHLQLVLAKTQEKAASSLTEVTWLGKKVPVKSEKLRVGFVKLQQLEGELSRAEGGEAKMDVYERLLMECQDAMQMVRDELGPEPVSRVVYDRYSLYKLWDSVGKGRQMHISLLSSAKGVHRLVLVKVVKYMYHYYQAQRICILHAIFETS